MTSVEDKIFIEKEFAKWWKIPSDAQIESFCERVSIMIESGIDENESRKIVLDKVIYGK